MISDREQKHIATKGDNNKAYKVQRGHFLTGAVFVWEHL